MKILLIDNGTRRIEQIMHLLKGAKTDLVNPRDLSRDSFDGYNLVFISGGRMATAFTSSDTFKTEVDLIKNSSTPIFGVCLGFQLIAQAYGAKFKKLEPQRRGIVKVKIDNTTLTNGLKLLKVFESHKWAVENVSKPLDVLARSEDGIEIVKHRDYPICGVQFHPEADIEMDTNGRVIFDNFMSTI